jgi:RNA polymerase-binding transcription factor
MSKQKKNSKYDQLKELLLAKRGELNRRIEDRRQEMVMDPEPEDEVGMALRNSSTGMAIANIERHIRTLAEIELSLRRIEAGEYGTCGLCGEQIPLARLKAIPWTRCCVHCAGGRIARRKESQRIPGEGSNLTMSQY